MFLKIADVLSVRTKFYLTGREADYDTLEKVINFVHDEYISTQIEETRCIEQKDALLWIANHATNVARNSVDAITPLPYCTDIFTSLNLIEAELAREIIYLDKFGNRLYRDEDGYVLENFFHRGYIAHGLKNRISKEIDVDTYSELINFVIDDTIKYLQGQKEQEKALRNELIKELTEVN